MRRGTFVYDNIVQFCLSLSLACFFSIRNIVTVVKHIYIYTVEHVQNNAAGTGGLVLN